MSSFILGFKAANSYIYIYVYVYIYIYIYVYVYIYICVYIYIYKMVNGHEQSYVSRMSCVLNENSDLLLLNSHILSLGIQYVKKNETVSF